MSAVLVTTWLVSLGLGLWVCLFIFRIILSWYPQVDRDRPALRWIIVPTEPFLIPTRKVIPPLGGLDITPVVWVGISSLLRELLVGQQGLLTLWSRVH